jgi:hypothetical protein
MLKATAATTAGAALFTSTASASDDPASFEIECIGSKVRVTLTSVKSSPPTDLDNLQIFLGKEDVVDTSPDNGRIDRLGEIYPCFDETDEINPSGDCPAPVAFPESRETDSGSIVFTFDQAEAGLDDVTTKTNVVIAGVYGDLTANRPLTFDSLEETVVHFDPTGCCPDCKDGLLVKYEWTGNEFEEEEGSDSNITLTSVHLDEDDEPEKACFTTSYCELWAVVKAGTNYDPIQVRENSLDPIEFCVEPSNGKAISNIQFFCKEPTKEDYELGNSDKSDEDGNKGNKGNNGKKK